MVGTIPIRNCLAWFVSRGSQALSSYSGSFLRPVFLFFPRRYSRPLCDFFSIAIRHFSSLPSTPLISGFCLYPVGYLRASPHLQSPSYFLLLSPNAAAFSQHTQCTPLIIPSYLLSSKSNVPSPPISHGKLLNTHFAVSSPFCALSPLVKNTLLDYFSAPILSLVCLSLVLCLSSM